MPRSPIEGSLTGTLHHVWKASVGMLGVDERDEKCTAYRLEQTLREPFDVDRGVQVPFSSTRLVRIIAWWKYHKPLDLQFGLC